MKANELPEKIFICDYGSEVSYEWHSESEFETKGDNDIEYIRKDTFIEKACDWLKNHNDYIDVKDGNITYFDMEKCVEDLRKYMRGGDE